MRELTEQETIDISGGVQVIYHGFFEGLDGILKIGGAAMVLGAVCDIATGGPLIYTYAAGLFTMFMFVSFYDKWRERGAL
ncbi:MAG: hypothetical protein ACHQJ6_00125 [Candidatus Berkiellales bacterium]